MSMMAEKKENKKYGHDKSEGKSGQDANYVQFVDLKYSNVKLKNFSREAQRTISLLDGESGPIVYCSKPLTDGFRTVFHIMGKEAPSDDKAGVCRIGLTTCNPSNLQKFNFHSTDACKDGERACKGWSITFPIHKHNVIALILHKQPKGSLAVLTTLYSNESKFCALQDKSGKDKMNSVPLYPFIILDGLAHKIQVTCEEMNPAIRVKRPLKGKQLAIDEKISSKVQTRKSWLVGNGINFDGNKFYRKAGGSHFLACVEPLTNGQEYIFNVIHVDKTRTEETFTAGYTTSEISRFSLDTLALSEKQNSFPDTWTVFSNILPGCPETSDEIRIIVIDSKVFLLTKKYAMRQIFSEIPKDAHFFIKMTTNILALELIETTSGGDKLKQLDSVEGMCCICLEVRATYMLLPCSHLCLCATCFSLSEARSDELLCPLCKQKVMSNMVVYLS